MMKNDVTYLIVGDIHGNIEGLGRYQDLFDIYDRVIFVGDYMDRGSNSIACMKMAYDLPNGTCLIGNHEWKYYSRFKQGNINFIPRDVPKNKKMDFWEMLFAIMYKHGKRLRFYQDENILVSHAPAALYQHDVHDAKLKDKFMYGHKAEERDEQGHVQRKSLVDVYGNELSIKPLIYGHIHLAKFKIRENEYCVDFDSGKGGPLAALGFKNDKLIAAYHDGKEVDIE